MTQTIEGDWYLHLEGQALDAAVLPRYTLRNGRIFHNAGIEHVGLYKVDGDVLKMAISEDDLLTFHLPGPSEHTLSGTMVSTHGGDGVISEAAMLLRAIEQPANH